MYRYRIVIVGVEHALDLRGVQDSVTLLIHGVNVCTYTWCKYMYIPYICTCIWYAHIFTPCIWHVHI